MPILHRRHASVVVALPAVVADAVAAVVAAVVADAVAAVKLFVMN